MNIFLKIWYNYLDTFVKFKDFKGRSNKYEFWGFMTVDSLVKVALSALAFVASPFLYIYILYSLLCVVPTYAAITRRIHDVGRSGWWLAAAFLGLLAVIPYLPRGITALFAVIGIVSIIYVFVLTLCPSGKDNKYGVVPECTKEEALFGNLLIILCFAIPVTFAAYTMKNNQIGAEIIRNNLAISDMVTPQTTPLATSATVPQNSAQ